MCHYISLIFAILSWVSLCGSTNVLWDFVLNSADFNKHLEFITQSQGMMPLKSLILVIDALNADQQESQLLEVFTDTPIHLQVKNEEAHCNESDGLVGIVDLTLSSTTLSYAQDFNPDCVWLYADTPENREKLIENAPALNSHVILMLPDNETQDVTMTEVYSPDPENIQANFFDLSNSSKEIWTRRGNLMGTRLNLVYVESPNYMEVSENGTKAKGFVADVVAALSEQMNFTYSLVPSYDGNFGAKDENGTWNGMIRMLMDGGFHFGAALTSVTMVRSEVVDYTEIMSASSNELWIKTSSAVDYKAFLNMFRPNVWIMTSTYLLLSIIFGYIMGRVALTFPRDNVLISHAMLGLFLQQGSVLVTNSTSVKCLIFTMAGFSVFFFNAFSAHLTSSLTVHRFSDNIRNFVDLLEAEDYDFYVVGGSSLAQTFTSAEPRSVRRRLWEERVLQDDKFHTPDYDLIGKYFLESENHAAIYIYSRLMSVWNKKNPGHGCELSYVEVPGDVNFGAFPLPKKSPYKDLLDHVLRAWRESGIDENNFWGITGRFKEDFCNQDRSSRFEATGMSSVISFFALLTIGGCISLLLLFQETLSKRSFKIRIVMETDDY